MEKLLVLLILSISLPTVASDQANRN